MKRFLPQKIIFWLSLLCIFILLIVIYSVFTKRVSQKVLPPVEQPEVFQTAPSLTGNFGFNIHSLSKESEEYISCLLSWLTDNCGTSIVRLWGYQNTHGVNGLSDLEKVLNASPSNVKFIVALEDFPFGPAASNPGAWFASGYKSQYRPYAEQVVNKYKNNNQIIVWEIMNEPHCKGDSSCLSALYSFMQNMASLIKGIDPSTHVSPGLMGGHIPWSDYEEINNITEITATSCHYNSNTNSPSTCQEAMAHKGNTSFFYVGEAGYQGNANCSGGGCTNSNCTNCCEANILNQRASQVSNDKNALSAANAFLVWQFSPPGNSNLICDNFSVFPGDPICSGQEDFTCSPTPPTEESSDLNNPTNARSVWRAISEKKESSTSGSVGSWQIEGPDEGETHLGPEVTETKQQFPDFASLKENFENAFWALMPNQTAKQASLPKNKVEMKATTYAIPLIPPEGGEGEWQPDNAAAADIACTEGDPTPEDDVAKETLELTKWSTLVGSLTGVAGMIRPTGIINDLNLYRTFSYFMSEEDWRCGQYSFGIGPILATSDFEEAEDDKETFRVKNLITLIIEFFQDLFVREEKKGVEMRLYTKLPGGNTAITKSQQVSLSFLPEKVGQEFKLESEVKQIAGELTAVTGLSPREKQTERFNFAGQADTWWATCSTLCSAFPAEWIENNRLPWVGVNNFCPSCNPDDYHTFEFIPIERPPNWPPYCDWNEAYGCDYYTCKYKRGDATKKDVESGEPCGGCDAGEVPFCEDTGDEYIKCGHPDGLSLEKDVRQPQGPCSSATAGWDKACVDFGQCVGLNFTSSVDYYQSDSGSKLAEEKGLTEYIDSIADTHGSGPPYGPCFYANPNVCVREGVWNNWDNCAVGCSGLCCRENWRNYP